MASQKPAGMEFFGAGGRAVVFDDAAAGYGNGDNFDGNCIFYVLCGGGGAKKPSGEGEATK